MLHELCAATDGDRLRIFLSTLKSERGEDGSGLNSLLDARNAQRYTPLHTSIFHRSRVTALMNLT